MYQALAPPPAHLTLHALRAHPRGGPRSRECCERREHALRSTFVSARTLARSIQDVRDSRVRHLPREFSDNVGCRCIEDPAMFSVARLAHVDLRVISSLPMNL